MRTTSVLLALLIPLVSVARSARAAEAADTWDTLIEQCQNLPNAGDYTGALNACERAYALKPEPRILAYMAQVHTVLLHPVQARDALRRYLRSASISEENRKTAEAQLRHLETLITTLSVTTRVEGAEVRIDDQVTDLGALERGVELPAGAHRVTLQSKGAALSRFIFLRAGERTQIELPGGGTIALSCAIPHVRFFIDEQEVDAAQASRGVPSVAGGHRVTFKVGAATSSGQTVVVHPDQHLSVVCAPPPSAQTRSGSNPRGYWVMGAGLALSGAALATGIYNGNEYDRWQTANDSLRHDILTDDDLTLAEQRHRAQENNELMDRIQARRKVAIGLGIAGGLITAGGVALLFSDSAASERNSASSWFRKIASGVTFNGAMSSGEIAWRGAW